MQRLPGLHLAVVGALQDSQELAVTPQHEGGLREQHEVFGTERLGFVGSGERLVGLRPCPCRVALATPLERGDRGVCRFPRHGYTG
jgi:hypothetical protein